MADSKISLSSKREVEWLCRARKALPSLKTSDRGLEDLPLLETTGGGVCWAEGGGGRILSSVLENNNKNMIKLTNVPYTLVLLRSC